jgi:formate dehydrogenase maturation protein FdhE
MIMFFQQFKLYNQLKMIILKVRKKKKKKYIVIFFLSKISKLSSSLFMISLWLDIRALEDKFIRSESNVFHYQIVDLTRF